MNWGRAGGHRKNFHLHSASSQIQHKNGSSPGRLSKQPTPDLEVNGHGNLTHKTRRPTLLIDNYDSYTYNVFQDLARIEEVKPVVVLNDELSVEKCVELILQNSVASIVISPGPGSPDNPTDTGICLELVRRFPQLPILGVCLGHQILAEAYGGTTRRVDPVHGRLSRIRHNGNPLFAKIPSGAFSMVRYHSLAVDESTLASVLQPIAWTVGKTHALRGSCKVQNSEDSILMGLAHTTNPHYGVQFHPESIGSEFGVQLFRNFKKLTQEFYKSVPTEVFLKEMPLPRRQLPISTKLVWKECKQPLKLKRENLDRLFTHFTDSADLEDTFWLDSSMEDRGRFSFMGKKGGSLWKRISYRLPEVKGTDGVVLETDIHGDQRSIPCDLWQYLDQVLSQHHTESVAELPFEFHGGFVGYLGYELKALSGGQIAHHSPVPDAVLFFIDQFLAIDHTLGKVYCVTLTKSSPTVAENWVETTAESIDKFLKSSVKKNVEISPALSRSDSIGKSFQLDRSQAQYEEDVRSCQEYLYSGESYEICLTTQFRKPRSEKLDGWKLYRDLRRRNPAPYSSWLRFSPAEDLTICSSSPERFLQCNRSRILEAKPIKGTAARRENPEEDELAQRTLATSEKDQAENLMIVDLLRNDLGRVCQTGSVHVPGLLKIESFKTVHQMVSTVCGTLSADSTIIDAVKAAFPGGSMTGAPKVRSMEIIDKLEGHARGVYSGSIGYLSVNQTFDLNIVIRTIVLSKDEMSIGAGGAIVVQSDPHEEYEEMRLKARALLDCSEAMEA